MKTNVQRSISCRMLALAGAAACVCFLLTGCGNAVSSVKETFKLPAVNSTYDTEIKQGGDAVQVAQSGALSLTINGQTTEICVKNETTGAVWRSNPANADQDTTANGVNKEWLHSQVALDYVRTSDNLLVPVNSYSGCLSYGRYSYYAVPNGIGVRYALGEPKITYLMPTVIGADRFKNFLSKLDDTDQQTLQYNYTYLSLSEITDAGSRTAMLQKYPILKSRNIYVLGGSSIGEVQVGDILAEMLDGLFRKAGYTEEDLQKDNTDNKVKVEKVNDYTVYLSVEYTLKDGNLQVRVPKDSIHYDESIMSISTISLMPMFGAGSTQESGDLLVPDGSGALIHFNNGKTNVPAYSRTLYSEDKTVGSKTQTASSEATLLHLPVYGVRTPDKAFVAMIEKGDSVATIHADTSGKSNDFNYIYPSFLLKQFDTVSDSILNIAGNRVYQKVPFNSDLEVRYLFLSGGDTSYGAMAGAYRDALLKDGQLVKQAVGKDFPLYVDAIGAVDFTDTFAGIPFASQKALTTYSQAQKIMEDLLRGGVKQLDFGMVGGGNGGISNTLGNTLRALPQLGGKSGLKKLISWTKQQNIAFYPEINYQYVSGTSLFDGFSQNRDTAKNLVQNLAKTYDYNLATLQRLPDSSRWILSPGRYGTVTDGFLHSVQKWKLDSWNVSTFGTDLNSDFSQKALIDRQKAETIVSEQLKKMKAAGSLSISGANAYTLPYASIIKSMPMSSGKSYLLDEDIPFYPMVLHGEIPYTSEALNFGENGTNDFLRAVEYGAIPYYQVMSAENFVLKDTNSNFYAANYTMWKTQILANYAGARAMLGDLQGCTITGHRSLQTGVTATTYSNGQSIIVNYTDKAVTIGGITVAAQSFGKTGGKLNG